MHQSKCDVCIANVAVEYLVESTTPWQWRLFEFQVAWNELVPHGFKPELEWLRVRFTPLARWHHRAWVLSVHGVGFVNGARRVWHCWRATPAGNRRWPTSR